MNTNKNRPIKFRVFDLKLNKYINFNSLPRPDFDSQEYVFEEFTGLFDKNNKEIYEGDIIQLNDGFETIVDVCYIDGCFMVNNMKDYFQETDLLFYWSRESEVIGNIFENSNLLPSILEDRNI